MVVVALEQDLAAAALLPSLVTPSSPLLGTASTGRRGQARRISALHVRTEAGLDRGAPLAGEADLASSQHLASVSKRDLMVLLHLPARPTSLLVLWPPGARRGHARRRTPNPSVSSLAGGSMRRHYVRQRSNTPEEQENRAN